MRHLFALALFALVLAAPTRAQIAFSPLVGYDIDREGATVGVAFELGTTLDALPLSPALRPSVEYVFAGSNRDALRAELDLVGRFAASPGVLPYVKLGPTLETRDNLNNSRTVFSINAGGGVEFNRIFVEGATGFGPLSGFRVRAGYRF
jgi:hypothetical protein